MCRACVQELTVDDFLLVDDKLNVLSGSGLPNKANLFHVHVYKQRPDMICLIHTHAPHAAALSYNYFFGEQLHYIFSTY